MSKKREDLEDSEYHLLEEYEKLKKKIKKLKNKDVSTIITNHETDSTSNMAGQVPEVEACEKNYGVNGGDQVWILDPENMLDIQENIETARSDSINPQVNNQFELDCLDESLLELLGQDPTETGKIKMELHPSLWKRWKFWAESGLQKQQKRELGDKYERTPPFEAPKLNKEIAAVLKDSGLKRDKYFCDQQNSVGSALASLGLAISSLLKKDNLDKFLLLERLGNAGKLLSNLYFELAEARKAFITPGLNRSLKSLLLDKSSDEWLFGAWLAEKVKEAKAMETLKKDLKTQQNSRRPLQGLGSRTSEESTEQNTLNVSLKAGRLRQFYKNWLKVSSDPILLSFIKGYKLRFAKKIVYVNEFIEPVRSKYENEEISLALQSLIEKGTVVPCRYRKDQFLSNYFVIPKPNGDKRSILNLKKLNGFIETEHFKMEDIRAAIRIVAEDYFMTLIDLEDAYFLIPIHEDSKKFLRFKFQDTLYEFVCLPFGLCSAPWIFSKVMKPVMGLLRERGFLSVIYLDDILCVGRSNEVCQSNTEETIALLEFLGFIVNYKKSVLKPSQRCTFLGFIIDSSSMELELPEEKKLSLKKFIKNLISKEECCIRHFAQLIGILVAANQAIKYSWLYIKSLEREKYLELRKNRGNYEANMKLSVQALEDLGWWEANILNSSNSTRRDKFDVTIFTDASTSGWGAVCDKIQPHGFWTMEERNKHINYLELLAIYNALTSLETLLKGKNALLSVDNTTAVAYVNKMGGVRFKDLNMLARKIWKWAECNKVWMFASYIPSLENTGADSLSRIVNIDTENGNCQIIILVGSASAIEQVEVNCSEGIRQFFRKGDIKEDAIKVILASLADSTRKQYDSSLIKWKNFCNKTGEDPFILSTSKLFDFLMKEFKKGASFSVLNTHKSAVMVIFPNNDLDIKLIAKFMRGIYKLRPSNPRYDYIWDVSLVLDKVKDWYPLEELSLQSLTEKALILLALATGHRVQTFAAINVKNIEINEKELVIKVPKLLKTSRPGKYQPMMVLPFFEDQPEICVAKTLVKYLEVTNHLRGKVDEMFITLKKPFRPASSQTISRWIKFTLYKCGIDTSKFKAHSTRHASTSTALRRGVDIELIRKTAGWSGKSQQLFEVMELSTSSSLPDKDLTAPPYCWNLGLTRPIELPAGFDPRKVTPVSPLFEADNPPDLQEMFRQFNILAFNGDLPEYSIRWSSRITSDFGRTVFGSKEIVISSKTHAGQTRAYLARTVLREMIHAYLDMHGCPRGSNAAHGPEFKAEVARLRRLLRVSLKTECGLDREALANVPRLPVPDSFRANWGPNKKRLRRKKRMYIR
ncbi:uncharacterized protein [Prorops nasuta]|uniref:uncharacterized protein n=1 Tax=Prorops nasuta TaxID=863751 RepID=UPI0034D01744